jgi:hypothetical protein
MELSWDERREVATLQASSYRSVTRLAARIRAQCGAALDKETAAKITRVFRAALLPRNKAGRKPDRETVRAAAIWVRYCGFSSKSITVLL